MLRWHDVAYRGREAWQSPHPTMSRTWYSERFRDLIRRVSLGYGLRRWSFLTRSVLVDDRGNNVPCPFSLHSGLCMPYAPVKKLPKKCTLIVYGGLDLVESQSLVNRNTCIGYEPLDKMLSHPRRTERRDWLDSPARKASAQ
jgi:hypothetical protein